MMKFRSVTLLVLVLAMSGCTTITANEINHHRKKSGGCGSSQESQCVDLIQAAIFDVGIGIDIARELIDQKAQKAKPAEIETVNVDCGMTEEKVCSTSFGCRCRPQNARDDTL